MDNYQWIKGLPSDRKKALRKVFVAMLKAYESDPIDGLMRFYDTREKKLNYFRTREREEREEANQWIEKATKLTIAGASEESSTMAMDKAKHHSQSAERFRKETEPLWDQVSLLTVIVDDWEKTSEIPSWEEIAGSEETTQQNLETKGRTPIPIAAYSSIVPSAPKLEVEERPEFTRFFGRWKGINSGEEADDLAYWWDQFRTAYGQGAKEALKVLNEQKALKKEVEQKFIQPFLHACEFLDKSIRDLKELAETVGKETRLMDLWFAKYDPDQVPDALVKSFKDYDNQRHRNISFAFTMEGDRLFLFGIPTFFPISKSLNRVRLCDDRQTVGYALEAIQLERNRLNAQSKDPEHQLSLQRISARIHLLTNGQSRGRLRNSKLPTWEEIVAGGYLKQATQQLDESLAAKPQPLIASHSKADEDDNVQRKIPSWMIESSDFFVEMNFRHSSCEPKKTLQVIFNEMIAEIEQSNVPKPPVNVDFDTAKRSYFKRVAKKVN